MTEDELDLLLQPVNEAPPPDFQAHVLRRTSNSIRRRVWFRRFAFAAVAAACYACGIATVLATRPVPTPSVDVRVSSPHVPEKNASSNAPYPAVSPMSPQQLELRAELADDAERARIYLVAGRRYAAERGDWESALRCYRQALDASPDEVASIDPNQDDWLLTALKIERQKETYDAIRNN